MQTLWTGKNEAPLEEVRDAWTRSGAAPVLRGEKRAKVECGFTGCASPLSRLWRKNGRPALDGKWGCSRTCLRAMVESAVRREHSDAEPSDAPGTHRHRVPLGLVLLAQGWITQPQLSHALSAQRAAGRGRIGEWLVKESGVTEMDVARGLGVQWNCPVLSANGMDAAAMALVMPPVLRESLGVVPVRVAAEKLLYLGFESGIDAATALAIERMSGITVESGLMSSLDYVRSTARLRQSEGVTCSEQSVEDHEALADSMVKALENSQPHDARVVRLRESYWLRMWLEPMASHPASRLPRSGEDVQDIVYRVSPRR